MAWAGLRSIFSFFYEIFWKKLNYDFIYMYRIAIGSIYVLFGILYFPFISKFYGSHGIVTYKIFESFRLLRIIGIENLDSFTGFCWTLFIICSLFVIAGFYSKIFLILATILFQYFVYQESKIFEGIVHFLKIFSFFMLFLPLDSKVSVRNNLFKENISTTGFAWPFLFIRIQLVFIYLVPSISRFLKETYSDPHWSMHVIVEQFWTRVPLADWMLDLNPMIGISMTRYVICLEAFAVLFLFHKRTRRYYAYLLIIAHLSIFFLTKVYIWQLGMIMFITTFLVTPEPGEADTVSG